MVTVVPGAHDWDMIWWVLAAAVVVIVGLVYVMSHESDFCPAEVRRPSPGRRTVPVRVTPGK
jgi:hypothetical protein